MKTQKYFSEHIIGINVFSKSEIGPIYLLIHHKMSPYYYCSFGEVVVLNFLNIWTGEFLILVLFYDEHDYWRDRFWSELTVIMDVSHITLVLLSTIIQTHSLINKRLPITKSHFLRQLRLLLKLLTHKVLPKSHTLKNKHEIITSFAKISIAAIYGRRDLFVKHDWLLDSWQLV